MVEPTLAVLKLGQLSQSDLVRESLTPATMTEASPVRLETSPMEPIYEV